VPQCEAVRAAVCSSAHGGMRAVRAAVCDSALSSVWQCTWQCAAVQQCGSVRQVCGSARGCVRQCIRQCAGVQQCAAVCGSL
jgi:hypothetical protein